MNRMLGYGDLAIAFAFIRDAEDEDPTGQFDHPDFYGTSSNGVRRAALPHLSEREHVAWYEIEDALIECIDNIDPEPEPEFEQLVSGTLEVDEVHTIADQVIEHVAPASVIDISTVDMGSHLPKQISGRRASDTDNGTKRGPSTSWKDARPVSRQYLRHL